MSAYYPNGVIPHELRCPHTPARLRPLFCEQCTADDAFKTYITLKKAYYAGEPLCEDWHFDNFEKYCKEKWPNDRRFHDTVGTGEEK